MSKRRRSSGPDYPETTKRTVTHSTFLKWKKDFDRDYQSVSWLECETETVGGKRTVCCLKCTVCMKFKDVLRHRRNFNECWVTGANTLKTSNIRDHAQSEQHAHAMALLAKERAIALGEGSTSYAPIAQALTTLSEDEKRRLRYKFDIAYLVAVEKISFRKYPQICELEARHGINIGTGYTNDTSASTFVHYIAESQRQELVHTIQVKKFFSLLLDGSTDTGNIDNELILLVWYDASGSDEMVHTYT